MNTQIEKGNGTMSPEQLAVQHGIATYAKVQQERDEALKNLESANKAITVNKIEIESLRAELAAERSRCSSYQLERDDAVANLVVYQTLFMGIQALLRTFGIEHAPLVKDAKKFSVEGKP
jgi:hypothetical protein